jgi:hypothetical protein
MRGRHVTAVIADGTRVRLAPGSHASPREGVCVVELASLIAREEFSDQPRCVCPVIGAFLRGWNDRAAHAERQRLAPYALRIVDSRGDRRVTHWRRDLCLEWAGANLDRGPIGRFSSRLGIRLQIALFCGLGAALRRNEGVGDYAARLAVARGDVDLAFAFLDMLLGVGEETHRPVFNGNGNGDGSAHLNRNGYARLNGNGRTPDGPNGAGPAEPNGSSVNGGDPAVPVGSRRFD